MRLIRTLILLLCFGWIVPLQAQDELTPYEIALQRIEEARVSGATELELLGLKLTELPPEIGQVTNLESLYLVNIGLSSLPPEIGQLSNLRVLSLHHNQLSSLPSEVGHLVNLQILSLNNNQLNSLPSEIGRLINLEWLDLYNNQLNSLPIEIGQLSKVCYFDIRSNNLRYLPNTLINLPQLMQVEDCGYSVAGVYVDGNPLISPPEEVIAQGTPAILAYLRNEAWWHIRKMVIYAASVVGGMALLVLGLLRWRRMRLVEKKKR